MKAQQASDDGSSWILSFGFTWIPHVSPENVLIITFTSIEEQIVLMGTEVCSVE